MRKRRLTVKSGLDLIYDMIKSQQLSLFGDEPAVKPKRKLRVRKPRPPGAGWQIIPAGRRGGYRKRSGKGWEYWYPNQGVQDRPHRDDVPQPRLVMGTSTSKKDAVTDVMAEKKSKAKRKSDNDLAIEIVQKAIQAGRGLTDEEAVKVAAYSGKGGISGDLNQYYTKTEIASALWGVMDAPMEAIDHIREPVLAENESMIDETIRTWYEKPNRADRKLLVRGPGGVTATPAKDIGAREIVYPWGKGRAELIEAAIQNKPEGRWQSYNNPVLRVLNDEYGDLGDLGEVAKEEWERRAA